MDHLTALSIFDNEMKKIRNDTNDIMVEFFTVKKNIQEKISDLETKNHASLRDIPVETEELNKEIMAMEKELAELEIQCSKEANLLSVEQKIADDQAQEMKMMNDFKMQYKNRIAKASAKPSKKDIEFLENCKKKLEAYVKLTGVIWDYDACDENTISGYIRNVTDTRMKIFNVSINGKSQEEISEEMWKLIKKYSME